MLFNTKNKTVIASKVKVRKSFLGTAIGLMFQRLKDGEAMLLDLKKEKRADIHTFFLLHSIDVAWLNNDLQVKSLAKKVKPFKPWVSPKTKSRYIVEMRPGAIEKYKINIGDNLFIMEQNLHEHNS